MREYVLSNGEVIRLKRYIEQKYENLGAEQKLAIWSDAAHRIIESRLPAFPDEVKKRMRAELLYKQRETLVIHQDDALREFMTLDLNQEELLAPLTVWVSSRSALPLEDEDVRYTLQKWAQHTPDHISLEALAEEDAKAAEASQPMKKPGCALDETAAAIEITDMANLSGAAHSATPAPLPMHRIWLGHPRAIMASVSLGCLAAAVILVFTANSLRNEPPVAKARSYPSVMEIMLRDIRERESLPRAGGIPAELRYVEVDKTRVRVFLQDRGSLLADEPYLSAIIASAKRYDIHPLLLFAITGQEQGFVPKDHKEAERIANNPFNVFGSWESYNTSIEASADIAAKTVRNISRRRQGSEHPIQWLNRTYAEDPEWWTGVTWIFNTMQQQIEGKSFEWAK